MELKVTQTTLELGLPSPVRLMHVTDAHVCRAYADEGDKLVRLAKQRGDDFGGEAQVEALLESAIRRGAEQNIPFVFTGDLYDFISRGSLDYLQTLLDPLDYLCTAGNHDFCTAPGADVEDHPFKLRQLPRIAPRFRSNLLFDHKIVGGVNLVAMDNSYHQFFAGQLDLLKAEAARGLPILLFLHVPLFEAGLAESVLARGSDAAYVTAAPDEVRARYAPHRAEYQKATEVTMRCVEYIESAPEIRAVFAGHTHYNYESALPGGTMQYVTGGTYRGEAREICLI